MQIASQLNPLHHLVELVRHACFGFEATTCCAWQCWSAFAVVMWRVAVNRMEKRLID